MPAATSLVYNLLLISVVVSHDPSRGNLDLLVEAIDIMENHIPPILLINETTIGKRGPVYIRPTVYGPKVRMHFKQYYLIPFTKFPVPPNFSTSDFFASRISQQIRIMILQRLASGQNTEPDPVKFFVSLNLALPDDYRSKIVLAYVAYLVSFLYMPPRIHEQLVVTNKLMIDTDATTIAHTILNNDHGPAYISPERIFEWYRMLFIPIDASDRTPVPPEGEFRVRYDVHGKQVIAAPVHLWVARFLMPRLRRLSETGRETFGL